MHNGRVDSFLALLMESERSNALSVLSDNICAYVPSLPTQVIEFVDKGRMNMIPYCIASSAIYMFTKHAMESKLLNCLGYAIPVSRIYNLPNV